MKESEGLYRSFRFLKRALIALAVVVLGLLLFGYFFFMRHVDAPKAWAAAERELQGGVMRFGERVERRARVFVRRPSDYFRGANGVLYATNDRLIFIGVAPGEKFKNSDAPPVIVSQEFPNDTLLELRPQRLYLLTARGVKLSRPGVAPGEFAAVSGQEAALDSLVAYVSTSHAAQKREAARTRRMREAVAALVRQPLYYRVKRGDALSIIATKFDATPEQIRQWNNIVGDRVRIGDKLLVKPAKK